MRKVYAQVESIPYGPRTESDQHRQRTLHVIYNYNDAECIGMLRMRRALFSLYATFLELEALYQRPMVALLRSRLQCFCMLLVITKGLG
jgi:hypothetical protein